MTFTASDIALLLCVVALFALNYLLACRRDRSHAQQIEAAVVIVVDQWAATFDGKLAALAKRLESRVEVHNRPAAETHEELVQPASFTRIRKPGLFREESGIVPVNKGE